MEIKVVHTEVRDEDNNIISIFPYTAADDDWIRAGRLAVKARKGNKSAAAKLKKMQETIMVTVKTR